MFGILASAAAAVLLVFAYQVRAILLLAYVSALFAMGLSPLVNSIERRRVTRFKQRIPRWLAILLIYAVILAAIVGIASVTIPPLAAQAEELWRVLPEKIDQGQRWLMRYGILRQPITLGEAVQQAPASGSATAVATIFGAVRNVLGGVFGIVMLVILSFYMLVDSANIFAFFVRLFPKAHRARVATVAAAVTTKVSAWLGGQLLLAMIIGVTSAFGLGLLGVPYFFVLALIAAIGEMIPMVGPILSAIPAILVALTVSPALAIAVTIFCILQQQLENTILVPRIMGRQVGLSPVIVILSLSMGGELLGIVGAILAVPTAAIIQVLVQELLPSD